MRNLGGTIPKLFQDYFYLILLIQLLPLISARICFISDYVSDPTNATAGIQAAVYACSFSTDGGGFVFFDSAPAGNPINYTTGAILITGHDIHLIIPQGVTLLAGIHREDYPGPQSHWYLLHFRNCSRCSVSGGGTIDGQAQKYVIGRRFDRKDVINFQDESCFNPWECRPRMIGVVGCSQVSISNISILDPIYWTVHVIGSHTVYIRRLIIRGDWEVFNNDGLDIDSSSHVYVWDSDIQTADDAICIKTTLPGIPVRNIFVFNCTLRSRAAAVKLGSESVANMEDLKFLDLRILDSHRGLAIQLRDGGSISNVAFHKVHMDLRHEEFAWWGASEIIYVTAVPRKYGTAVGRVQNISFFDIKADSENGIFISGAPEQSVRNVKISNIRLRLRRKSDWPGGFQDYRPSEELDVSQSGGTAAVWVENAADVSLSDVAVEYVMTPPRCGREDWKEKVHIDEKSTLRVKLRRCTFDNVTASVVYNVSGVPISSVAEH